MDTFYRSFLGRCLLVSIALSVAAGGIGFLTEVIKLDRLAEAVAREEVRRLRPDLLAPQAQGSPGRPEPERRVVEHNCLFLRVYDGDGRLRLEAANPEAPVPRPALEKALERSPDPLHLRIRRLDLLGRPAVHLQSPLAETPGKAAGSLEAVFLLDPADIQLLKGYIQRITLTALGAVLATVLLLYPIFDRLNRRLLRSLEAMVRGDLEMAKVLGAAIAQRDSDTGGHNARVTLYAIRLAESLGSAEVDMVVLILGAFLHDVGKIGIPDAILLKPGRLDEAETREMRTHVQKGLDIIDSSQWLQLAGDLVRCHHERFDGQGYPAGLEGSAIPLEARIFAIVDVFDALTSVRPYRQPMPFEEAMDQLQKGAGSHFDPTLVAAFLPVAREAHQELSHACEQALEGRLQAEVEARLPWLFAAEAIHTRVSAGFRKVAAATK
jgi:HD-GYP domain-containing protein (c-di-GMP phosphodiesterase class II)